MTSDTIDTLTAFFNFVDTDHDGFITVKEIKAACAVDTDGDGIITEAEMIASAAPWINTYLAQQDLDQDEKITLAELIAFNS